MYSVGGASIGFQVGGSATDFVLLIVTQKGVDAILKGKSTLGSDATAAGGPSGATAAAVGEGDDILTYRRSSGLFAAASLGNANLEPDVDANERLYGKAISAKELSWNKPSNCGGGQALVLRLNSKVAKHGD